MNPLLYLKRRLCWLRYMSLNRDFRPCWGYWRTHPVTGYAWYGWLITV